MDHFEKKPEDSGDETESYDELPHEEDNNSGSDDGNTEPQVAEHEHEETLNEILEENEILEREQEQVTPPRKGKQRAAKPKKHAEKPENFWRLYEKLESEMRSLKRRHAPESSPESARGKSRKIAIDTGDAYDRPTSSGYVKPKVSQLSTGKSKQLSSASTTKQSTANTNVRLSPARPQQLSSEQRSQRAGTQIVPTAPLLRSAGKWT